MERLKISVGRLFYSGQSPLLARAGQTYPEFAVTVAKSPKSFANFCLMGHKTGVGSRKNEDHGKSGRHSGCVNKVPDRLLENMGWVFYFGGANSLFFRGKKMNAKGTAACLQALVACPC